MNATSDLSPARLVVLVVDDNRDLLITLDLLFKALGADVVLANSGTAALVRARERPPDIVLLDIGLPDMDGYEAARRLRCEVGLKQAYLVGLSGHDVDEERSRAAGFDCHRLKPVSLETLREILSRRTPDQKNSPG